MYKNGILALLALSSSHLPLLATAQLDRQAYCDNRAPKPNRDKCFDIKDNGVSGEVSYGNSEWWSGNCRVNVYGGIAGSESISGNDLKDAIQNVMDTCDVGFAYYGGVRVKVDVCVLGSAGVVTECNSPLQKVSKKKRDQYQRRHFTDVPTTPNPHHVFSRQASPWEGLICGGGPGSAYISDCNDLAAQLRTESPDVLELPLDKSNGDCQVQAWATNRELMDVDTAHLTLVMEDDAQACADSTGEIIGFVEDYNGYVDEGSYHLFFGRFCGRLGAGQGEGCFPGGKI